MIYNTNDGGPGNSGALAPVSLEMDGWLCGFA